MLKKPRLSCKDDFYKMNISVNFRWWGTVPACDRRTGGWTDGRTDGRTDGIAVTITARTLLHGFFCHCLRHRSMLFKDDFL